MYLESSKILISKRVGWSYPIDSLFPIEISENNQLATSGRTISSFAQLATVENLFYTLNENLIEQDSFNKLLELMRLEASAEVLNKILDQHIDYDFEKNYDSIIKSRQSLFDEPLGYLLAIKCFEIFVSSNRSNIVQRNANLSFQMLKVELDGIKNDDGHIVSEGLYTKFYTSIKNAQKIIFPNQVQIIGDVSW